MIRRENYVDAGDPGASLISGTTRTDLLPDVGTTGSGRAYAFQFDGAAWQLLETFDEIGGPTALAGFARSIAIGNSQVLVGSPDRALVGGTGVAHPFAVTLSEPSPPANKIVAPAAGDEEFFGWAIDIDGEWAVIGGTGQGPSGDGPPDAGSAYVFRRVGGSWTDPVELVNPNPSNWDSFGRSVAISGDVIVVGAARDAVLRSNIEC